MQFSRRTAMAVRAAVLVCAAALHVSCASHLEFPPMGEPLPYTAKLDIPSNIKSIVFRYTESCGHIMEIAVGAKLEEALVEGAYRTFKGVVYEGRGTKDATPDATVHVDLVSWSFNLKQDVVYDRVPAELNFNAIVRVYDPSGKLLREAEVRTDRQERLRVEPLQKNCDYIINPFVQDSVIDFATKVSTESRLAFGTQPSAPIVAQSAVPGAPSAAQAAPKSPTGSASDPTARSFSVPVPAVSSAPSSLRFKAMVLDENSNLIFEGGERVRVRVDVVNTGPTPVQNATASLTGTPAILTQFPATTLPIPMLQPGDTKSLEFVATLPPTVQAQKAELHVVVAESGGAAAPAQSLALTVQPTGVRSDDVDQIPPPVAGFQHPHTFLVSIGIGAYRDQQVPQRKYASLDAEMVANYLQSLGGVPSSNVRLLQDWKALRPDIDEALLDWLPPHVTKESVVIVYFAGQALVNQAGEILLVPYEGNPASASRLYPLKDLQSALARLKAKQTILIFDGMVAKLPHDAKAKTLTPRWDHNGGTTIHMVSADGLSRGLEDDKHRHGLFTYYFLRALRGEADLNRDGQVTLGEVTGYVSQKVAWASKSQFNSEQRPLFLPTIKAGDKSASLVLTKLAAISGSESP